MTLPVRFFSFARGGESHLDSPTIVRRAVLGQHILIGGYLGGMSRESSVTPELSIPHGRRQELPGRGGASGH